MPHDPPESCCECEMEAFPSSLAYQRLATEHKAQAYQCSALLGQSVLGRLSAVTQYLAFSTSVKFSGPEPTVSPDLVHACISASTMARRSGRHSKLSAVVQVLFTARLASFVNFCFVQTGSTVISLVFRAFYAYSNTMFLLACRVPGMQQGILVKMICQ